MKDSTKVFKHFALQQEASAHSQGFDHDDLEQASKTISKLENELRQLKIENRLLSIDFDDLLSKQQSSEHRTLNALQANRQLKAQITELKSQNDQASEQVKLQLKSYAQLINHTRQDVLNSWKEFSQQIEISISTHPLKDYLKFTEFEIKSVQEQIFKNTNSPQLVSRLTTRIKKLHEQREYLLKVISASENELRGLATQIREKMNKLTNAGTIPPPPTK
jgi:chromosome segregation ATPase